MKKSTTAAMYLANLKNGSTIVYQIRQSYRKTDEDSSFGFRIVYDLGHDPGRHFELYNDYIVLFDDALLAAVSAACENCGEHQLERLLQPFLPEEAKRRLALFDSRSSFQPGPLTDKEKEEISWQIHIFDRRRLYYLRYGAVDQSRLTRLHEKCCRPLLNQSRDEREYWFAAEEAALSPGMYLQYVYAIFNVQKHFRESFAPWFPEALARDEVADRFLTELCGLNDNCQFWQGDLPGALLHPHLRRYLIMFFDYKPAGRSYREDFIKAFMARHRKVHWPERKPSRSQEEISEIFATPYEQLKRMTGAQLNRLYRKKAMQLHPDRGGDHNLFIELTAVYESLQCMKK